MLNITSKSFSLTLRPLGAKMVSLVYREGENSIELLYLPQVIGKKPRGAGSCSAGYKVKSNLPKPGDVFDETKAWGGDICAPSVSKCIYRAKGVGLRAEGKKCEMCECGKCDGYEMEVGDHGDFWTTKFKVKKQSKNSVTLTGATKEFRLDVTFSLQGLTLTRKYTVFNLTKYDLPFTFADHTLLPIPKKDDNSYKDYKNYNDYIELPGVKKMRVEWSFNDKLGKKDSIVNWPLKRQKPFADKLFARLNKDKDGRYRVFYKSYNHYKNPAEPDDYIVEFSSKELEYIGYWETQEGWPAFSAGKPSSSAGKPSSSAGKNGQKNLGLELTNTDRDNLTECAGGGKVWWIGAGEKRAWSIDLKVKS